MPEMSAKKWEKKPVGQRSGSAERAVNPMIWNEDNCRKPKISRKMEDSLAPTLGLCWCPLPLFSASCKSSNKSWNHLMCWHRDCAGKNMNSDFITNCIV